MNSILNLEEVPFREYIFDISIDIDWGIEEQRNDIENSRIVELVPVVREIFITSLLNEEQEINRDTYENIVELTTSIMDHYYENIMEQVYEDFNGWDFL